MGSTNPIFKRIEEYQKFDNDTRVETINNGNYERFGGDSNEGVMTINGTLMSLGLLILLLLMPALITWNWLALGYFDKVQIMMNVGIIAGLILGLIVSFKPTTAPYLSPLYAVAEGAALGGISAICERMFPGVVIQSIAATFATVVVMIFLYKSGLIRVTEKFRSVMLIVFGAIFTMYMISFVMGLFGNHIIANFLWSNSPLSIIVSVILCIAAALSLLFDFDRIEYCASMGTPKFMNWYCAFGILVSLVWLYLELLRLLAKFTRR